MNRLNKTAKDVSKQAAEDRSNKPKKKLVLEKLRQELILESVKEKTQDVVEKISRSLSLI